ncbi:T9SS type A sorting domain-containing protein [Winogradskyella thalassocola]|uniref:Por secretion system C-terminal sorting domain-containing protein n=1 Tax=Winogradskyella thalassocola TaxID=262004 RepID=A0A1G7Z107_9FLAO|nr:T9SS type A sorting domain-containing protein [Winogradskyella thalassocola]SDH01830.1 Por secretion system C-terminal sorting domain-containing protein [Winogradskyella thalassocola]
MKKTYIFYFLVTLFSFGFSQTIVTVDRANIVGPTTSGSDASISSTGFTRGSGIALSTAAANFTSNGWDATTRAQAVTNNDYIQWSTTASGSNNIEITELDIRLRRAATGPQSFRVYYSLDNFATTGLPVTTAQSSPTTASDFNFTGLSINSGTGGTITFRLYAWNASNANSWLRIPAKAAWSDFGIATPGLRLIGTITSVTFNSTESNIKATAFDPSDNINYSAYSVASGLTTANAIKVGEFVILDGGDDLTDGDILGTILTDLEFGISNSENLKTLAIFDEATNISEATVASGSASFTGISGLSTTDGGSKTFDVYATFNTNVNDNEQFQLTVTSATADPFIGSTFEAFDAGGALTSISGDDNRIEVTATAMAFDQQPTDTNQFEIMTPFPTVLAVDSNGSQDLDYNSSISLTATGTMDPSPSFYTMTNGLAVLDNVIFTEKQLVAAMIVYSPLPAVSNNFDITGPLITVANQDFDGTTPEWTYSTNVDTFDNSWGIDGYYGIIDSAIASPLDNPSFSGNIFGENDINDEGDNGTADFAVMTFETINISALENVTLSFDWDVHGYENDDSDASYTLIYDGVAEPLVYLVDGNGAIDTDEGTVTISIPSSVSTVALEISVKNRNDTNGFTGFDNFKITSVFDGFIHIDNGTFAGWKGGTPSNTTGANNAYVISGEYIVPAQVEINNFIINENAKVNIASGKSLKTNSAVANYGTLELNSVSTSYSSLITDNITGEVTYNRHVNQFASSGSTTGANDLISAPVTNSSQTFLALVTANADIPSGTIGGDPAFLFGPFDNNTLNDFINYTPSDYSNVITSGIGYRTASNTPTGSTFEFVGDVKTGFVSVPITAGALSTFNLIGNPYPSYLSLSSFLASNGTKFSASNSGVYGYKGDVLTGYTIWNQAYSDANPTARIAPGQGFFVASKSDGATIQFTPEMRRIGTTDDFISGRAENQNLAHLNIQVAKGNGAYQTALYFNDNASLSMDPGYDSEMFEAIAPAFSIYSRLVEDNTGRNLAAQAVSYSALSNVTIPLGINIAQGEQGVVSIAEHNIPEGTTVILEDNVANSFTNLLEGDYTFISATTLNNTGRFYLHFGQTTLGVNDNLLNGLEIFVNANPKSIVVKGQLEGQTAFKLFDIQGRLVTTQSLNADNTEHSIDASNLTAGIYVVQLQNTTGNRTQKVIIR